MGSTDTRRRTDSQEVPSQVSFMSFLLLLLPLISKVGTKYSAEQRFSHLLSITKSHVLRTDDEAAECECFVFGTFTFDFSWITLLLD